MKWGTCGVYLILNNCENHPTGGLARLDNNLLSHIERENAGRAEPNSDCNRVTEKLCFYAF